MIKIYTYNYWGVADQRANVIFKLRPMSILNAIFPSATMEREPLFTCHDCHHSKPKAHFALRQRTDKHGSKGEPSSRCLPCAERERHRCKNKKRKRLEEGTDSFGDPPECDRAISLEKFTEELHEKACTGVFSYSGCIYTQGISGEVDDIWRVIAARVWEATGFKFT